MHKIKKTGQECYKMNKPFQHNNVEYVNVLVPFGHTSKRGDLATMQIVKVSNLVEV